MDLDILTGKIIGCAIEVHRNLGPGLLESAYEKCLTYELEQSGVAFHCQYPLPIEYKEVSLDCGYRVDLFVENSVIIELKAVDKVLPIHQAQLLTYMKLAGASRGLLINFNVKCLKDGIKRFVL